LTYDYVIENGLIYDGTGNPWFKADIAVDKGRIRKVGKINQDREKTIDASGLIICPGFIDIHTHSEVTLLINGKAESAVRQGITLQVTGNCGGSCAPIIGDNKNLIIESNMRGFKNQLEVDWSSFGEYLDRLQNNRVSINVASLFGHGTIRMCIMGYDDSKPTKKELEDMKKLVAECMEDGAFGMSVGLSLIPGRNATTNELVELSKIVAKYAGIYSAHQGGKRGGRARIGGTHETIEIGERSGVAIHPVHHRPLIHTYSGTIEDYLKTVDDARMKGIDISCDVYPYEWASSGLSGMLPPWVSEGGSQKMLERLLDSETREKVKKDMLSPEYADTNLGFIARKEVYDKVILLHHSKSEQYIGKNLFQISEMMGKNELDAVLELFISEGEEQSGLRTIQEVIPEELLIKIFRHPTYMVGSDGEALAPYGALGKKLHHPRCYGAYPRILGRWVREKNFLPMEEAIRKMTSFPAQVLGIQDRGIIREQMWADLTVFNPETVIDKATFQNPHQYPEGIKYVLVNGQLVIENSEHTGALLGKVLRGAGYERKM
jgi:N-acyl-D-amino-acid deacylase